jgi:glycolate oxidase FAD binding subunit
MLAFEPPHFGATATIGGTIAANLSGPRRFYAGAARDFVLGCRLVNGKGEILHFGGEVMKNVAGYDLSRLMAGAFGTLGVLLEVSLKLLPRPEAETTLVFERNEASGIELMNRWAAQPLPISATAWSDGHLCIRLSGSAPAIVAAAAKLGGERLTQPEDFWCDLREHTAPFFADPRPLWRLALPSTAAPLSLDGPVALTWGGAQRWVKTAMPESEVRARAVSSGGHATLFRPAAGAPAAAEPFAPLTPALLGLHQRLKAAFDPAGILNPGRMYAGV